jgi:hypothetical protein
MRIMKVKLTSSVKLIGLALALAVAMPMSAMAQNSGTQPAGSPQVPQPPGGGVDWSGVGIGAATVAADVVSVPAKVVYAILGGITGGAGYAVTGGNSQVSNTIWRSSLGGDYVLTPAMVRGDQPIYFSGPTQTSGAGAASAAPVSSGSAPAPAISSSAPSSAPAQISSGGGSAPMSVVPSNSAATGQPIDNGSGPVTAGARHGMDIE